jgi:hypothetical protein
MGTYWIMAQVQLDRRIPPDPDDEEDDVGALVGYFWNFGVTALSQQEACNLVEELVVDGEIYWSESEVSPGVVVEHLSPEIIARAGDWTKKGIWYKSGRVFFPAD